MKPSNSEADNQPLSEYSKTNLFLKLDIENRDFDDICKILRAGEIDKIAPDTWALLADHLEGKIKQRTGRKQDVLTNLFVNEPALTLPRC